MTGEDFWWSPSMGMLLTEKDGLVWVVQPSLESLRHRLGTGPDSNPPMPEDAVRLLPEPSGSTPTDVDLEYVRACAAKRIPGTHPCRVMETRHCPIVYGDVCGDRPCARFESDDDTPWLPELAD